MINIKGIGENMTLKEVIDIIKRENERAIKGDNDDNNLIIEFN